jgi:hypothetical protein
VEFSGVCPAAMILPPLMAHRNRALIRPFFFSSEVMLAVRGQPGCGQTGAPRRPGGVDSCGAGTSESLFVDIETEIQFSNFHGVIVSSHSHDESERILRAKRKRSCGSPHPGKPVPRLREQPHRPIQPNNSNPRVARQL